MYSLLYLLFVQMVNLGADAIVFHEAADHTKRRRQANLESHAWGQLALGLESAEDCVRGGCLVVISSRFDVIETVSLSATLGGGLFAPAWLYYLDAKVGTLPSDDVAARPGLTIQSPVQSLSGGARSSRRERFRPLKGATTYKEGLLSTTAYPWWRYILILLLNSNGNSTALPPHGGSREYVLVDPF